VSVVVVTPPAEEPVEVSEVVDQLKIDGLDEAVTIAGFITAAREYAEGFQNRSYVTQTLELTLDAWPDQPVLQLPRAPLQSVESVTFRDYTGADTVWAPSNYIVDPRSTPGRLALAYGKSWPSVTLQPIAGITIRYVAGYGDASRVPQKIKQAITLLVGHWNENREAVQSAMQRGEALPVPFGVDALLWPPVF
jgi:uncharacterized phiE125 gp8 family phage protein